MYCPKCRAEYLEGVVHCPICDVALVEDLPPKERPAMKSFLSTAAILAAVGTAVTLILRMVMIFAPQEFADVSIYAASSALIGLADLAVVFFFVSFYREYQLHKTVGLRNAAILGMIAAAAAALLEVKGLLAIYNVHISSFIDGYFIIPDHWRATIPPVSSILFLIFFAVFYRSLNRDTSSKLFWITRLAIIGICARMVFQLFAFLVYFAPEAMTPPKNLRPSVGMLYVAIFTFRAFVFVYFFILFRTKPEWIQAGRIDTDTNTLTAA